MGRSARKQSVREQETVHGLLYGNVLCGFDQRTPNQWPPGHVWVAYFNLDEMTCQACKKEAEKIIKERAANG